MTNAIIDNSISSQNVILWQYDKAEKFCALVYLIENLGKGATEDFWKYFLAHVDDLSNADDFGLAVWGIMLGVKRPILTYTPEGETEEVEESMTTSLYRKVLKAKAKLLSTVGSMERSDGEILNGISNYLADIFGTFQYTSTPNVKRSCVIVTDNQDMSLTYDLNTKSDGTTKVNLTTDVDATGELADYYENHADEWQFWPCGVRDNGDPSAKFFAFKGQWVSEGTSAGTVHTVSNFGRSVFHPKTRSWTFYKSDGTLLTTAYTMTYVSGSGANNGTWTLGGGTTSATQTGRNKTVWRDYGVYFPNVDVMALWM